MQDFWDLTPADQEVVRGWAGQTASAVLEAHRSMAAWLLASLLLINGGAMTVVVNAKMTPLPWWSLGFWSAGIVLALASGLWLTSLYADALELLLKLRFGMLTETEATDRNTADRLLWQGPWPTWIGLASLGCFAIKCVLFALGR